MSEAEFWDTTLRAISLKAEGRRRAGGVLEQSRWERTRWLAALLLSPNVKKGKTLRPRDLGLFPWEKERLQRKELTDRETEIMRKWDKS